MRWAMSSARARPRGNARAAERAVVAANCRGSVGYQRIRGWAGSERCAVASFDTRTVGKRGRRCRSMAAKRSPACSASNLPRGSRVSEPPREGGQLHAMAVGYAAATPEPVLAEGTSSGVACGPRTTPQEFPGPLEPRAAPAPGPQPHAQTSRRALAVARRRPRARLPPSCARRRASSGRSPRGSRTR